jgi:AraC-like DNA-binding protein
VVFCFLSNIILVPAILMPGDPDAMCLLRIVLLLSSPFLCAVLIFCYFGRVLKVSWWRRPIYALTVPYVLITGSVLVFALIPGTQLEGLLLQCYFYAGMISALLYLVCFIQALRMIIRALQRFSEENYSNPDDFPKQYAEGVLIIAILQLIMSWSTTINGSTWALSIGLGIMSVLCVVFLIGVLSPHRAVEVDQLEAGEAAIEPVSETQADTAPAEPEAPKEELQLSPERKEELLGLIRQQVEEKEAFLDSHLTLAALSRSCGINRTYISMVLTERLGGFFAYINRCRLDYADNYRAQNPRADVDEVALCSGFNNRQSYYNARKKFRSSASE